MINVGKNFVFKAIYLFDTLYKEIKQEPTCTEIAANFFNNCCKGFSRGLLPFSTNQAVVLGGCAVGGVALIVLGFSLTYVKCEQKSDNSNQAI